MTNKIQINLKDFPREIRPYLKDAEVFDVSSSKEFKTLYINTGYYLKIGKKGSLYLENRLTRKLYKKLIAPEVIKYTSQNQDYFLTRDVKGKNLLSYLNEPKIIIEIACYFLIFLHNIPSYGFPFSECMNNYFNSDKENYNIQYALKKYKNMTKEDAIRIKKERLNKLKNDVVIHGDYCLPNIILNNYFPSALVDLSFSGIGDHHIDIYWFLWSLEYNLGTDEYNDMFIDLYGKEKVDESILELIAALEILG